MLDKSAFVGKRILTAFIFNLFSSGSPNNRYATAGTALTTI